MKDLISPWVYGSRYLSGRRAANLQPPPSWKNFCSPRPQLDPWRMPSAWLDEESPRQRGSMGFLLRVGYMWILDYAERETAFENQFVQRNETNVTTNDNTVLFYFKFLEGNLISLTNRSFPHLLFFVLSDRLLQMVTQVISLTLRNLYYTWPTNTNPLRRVSWRPLGVLYLTDMLNAFFSRPAHDLTFFEGALEPCWKGEMSILFNGGCPPGPWVQVNSVTRQLRHVWLPRTAHGNDVQTACCFLNGDHTVLL